MHAGEQAAASLESTSGHSGEGRVLKVCIMYIISEFD